MSKQTLFELFQQSFVYTYYNMSNYFTVSHGGLQGAGSGDSLANPAVEAGTTSKQWQVA